MGAGVGRRPDTRSREELCRDPCAHRSHRSGGWARQPSSASPPPPSPPSATAPARRSDWSACLPGSSDTQAAFERAADVSGVPEDVLLAVGHLSSRWSQHDGAPSTSGGYGVMHLTDFAVDHSVDPAKGDSGRGPDRAGTLRLASDLTGLHRRAGPDRPRGQHLRRRGRLGVVPAGHRLAGLRRLDEGDRRLRRRRPTRPRWCSSPGRSSTCCAAARPRPPTLGDIVTLAADPDAQLDRAGLEAAGALEPGVDEIECPATIECEVIEALYVQTDTTEPRPQGLRQLRPRRPRERREHRLPRRARHRVRLRRLCRAHPDAEPLRVLAVHHPVRRRTRRPARREPQRGRPRRQLVHQHALDRPRARGVRRGPGPLVHRRALPLVRRARRSTSPRSTASSSTGPTSSGHEEFQSANYKWDPGPYWDWERYMELLGAPIRRRGRGSQPDRHGQARLRGQPERHGVPGRPQGPHAARACPARRPARASSTSTPVPASRRRSSAATTTTSRTATATPSPVTSCSSRRCVGDWIQTWWDGAEGLAAQPGRRRGRRARHG